MPAHDIPRSAHGLVAETVELYRRYPLIFLILAGAVIVPYEAIVLAATGAGLFSRGDVGLAVEFPLTIVDWTLIGPLVSALHVHAVREAREERDPRLGSVARQGLGALPVVAAASIISGLGIALGLIALVIPGIFLTLRWFVVAQVAAIERDGWLPALRRSRALTRGNYGHVLVFAVYVGLIVTVPTLLIGLAFDSGSTSAASFLVGLVVHVVAVSFSALATALLYFELRARLRQSAERRPAPAPIPAAGGSEGGEQSLDPRLYSDDNRPKGWYVDPDGPHRMHYWRSDDPAGWAGTTPTPRRIRRAWKSDHSKG